MGEERREEERSDGKKEISVLGRREGQRADRERGRERREREREGEDERCGTRRGCVDGLLSYSLSSLRGRERERAERREVERREVERRMGGETGERVRDGHRKDR